LAEEYFPEIEFSPFIKNYIFHQFLDAKNDLEVNY
jgi:hypothetical protein